MGGNHEYVELHLSNEAERCVLRGIDKLLGKRV